MSESEEERLERLLSENIPGWNDPENVRKREAKTAELERIAEARRAAEAPYVARLRGLGFNVDSAWGLHPLRGVVDLAPAIDVLMEMVVDQSLDEVLRTGAARALGTKAAHAVYDELLVLLRGEGDTMVGEALAGAIADLSVVDSDLSLLTELISETSLGFSRYALIERAARLEPRDRAESAVRLGLTGDDHVLHAEVSRILRKRFGYTKADVEQAQSAARPD